MPARRQPTRPRPTRNLPRRSSPLRIAPTPTPAPISAPASEPTAERPSVSPREVVIAGLYVALWHYGASSAFAADDAALAAHWPQPLTPGAALIVGCVSPEVAGGRPRLALSARLVSGPLTEADAERTRLAVHGVAARLAEYARRGRSGRFIYRAWGRGYRLIEASASMRGQMEPCAACGATEAEGTCERKAGAVGRIITSEPGVRLYIAHGPGYHGSTGEMERAAI